MLFKGAAGLGMFLAGVAVASGQTETPWSFEPLASRTPGAIEDESWPRMRIDRFLLARMEAEGLEPAPEAERRILVRRLYFDLVGLPPSPEAMERHRSQPVEEVVEELLANPHYGERWARHWLDLARYTDQTASWLKSTASAWLYRDWVVDAFNADMPYPDFVRRQLATDLLPETGPEDAPALGFLGLSPSYWKELQLPPEIIRKTVADEWEERVDAVGRTFLGLTLACARCHDHKSDPVSMADYYALAGVFANVRLADRPLVEEEEWAPIAQARAEVAQLEAKQTALKKEKPKPEDFQARLGELQQKIEAIRKSTPRYHMAMANGVEEAALYVEKNPGKHGTRLNYREGEQRDLGIHRRGDPNDLGEVVPRRFLAAFTSPEGTPREFSRGSGRLDLADAIIEDAAPLAARVLVNRVWRIHFGRGLVETPSDFGWLGERPSHPHLLDDLSYRFVKHGWSIKWLHREILNSAAWRQASLGGDTEQIDPGNQFLARMPRRRLEIEAWRDAMLSVGGNLEERIGGQSRALGEKENGRRTVYGMIHRRNLDPLLQHYDFPDPAAHSPARGETTTPLQQLFALNGAFVEWQADALVSRAQIESAEDPCFRMYQLLFQRPPSPRERDLAREFVDRNGWVSYAQALLVSNEFLFLD